MMMPFNTSLSAVYHGKIFARLYKVLNFATLKPLSFGTFGASKSSRYCPVFLSVFLCFSPPQAARRKFVDKLFKTGSVSHALLGMSQVPYSQLQ
jgi:hypothetical protein